MVLLVSYDLNGRERPTAYAEVSKLIQSGAKSWRRPLYSQWLIETDSSPDEWQKYLRQAFDQNDLLFICRVTRPFQGWLDDADWTWLNQRL